MALGIGPLGFGMARQIKDFNISLPDRLAAKDFMDRHGGAMDGPAVVEMLNSQLEPLKIFPIIRHSVQQVLRLSTRFVPRQPLERACNGLRRASCRSCNTRSSGRLQLQNFPSRCRPGVVPHFLNSCVLFSLRAHQYFVTGVKPA